MCVKGVVSAGIPKHLSLCDCSVILIFQVYPAEQIYPVPSLLMDRLNEKPRIIAVETILPARGC